METARIDPLVWSTGAWDEHKGLGEVEGLAEKLRLAHEFSHSRGGAWFFVPAPQFDFAQREVIENDYALELGKLEEGQINLQHALAACLGTLEELPPEPIAAVQQAYGRIARRAPERANSLYRRQLLPRVISQYRQKLQLIERPQLLLTIAGDRNTDLTELVVRAFCPEVALVLYTPGGNARPVGEQPAEHPFKQLQQKCEADLIRVQLEPFADQEFNELHRQLQRIVADAFGQASSRRVVVDLTPGTKLMTLALERIGRAHGFCLHYLSHRRDGNTPVPFSESPVWLHRDDADRTT